MADLVRSTLRLRPDRIIVGEVRGREALDMLKSWNTGHPGGIATVHANSATAALYRLEQLVQESVVTVPRRLIAEAIDTIVFISGRGLARRIDTIAPVPGLGAPGGYAVPDLTPSSHGDRHAPVPPHPTQNTFDHPRLCNAGHCPYTPQLGNATVKGRT